MTIRSTTARILILMSMICLSPDVAFAQRRPSISAGVEPQPIDYAECMRRAPLAFQAEGFQPVPPTGDLVHGSKDIHNAYIFCKNAPGGRTWVIVFVASGTVDGGAPGLERVRLEQRMARGDFGVGGPGSGGAGGGTGGPAGGGGGSGGGPAKPIKWDTQANPAGLDLRGKNGQKFTLQCPPDGKPYGVGGTDIYLDDSSICTAAVHQGLITFARGGTVTIEIRPGQTGYTGSTRNGITSGGFGSYWYGSFVFASGPPSGEFEATETLFSRPAPVDEIPRGLGGGGGTTGTPPRAATLPTAGSALDPVIADRYRGTWYAGGGCEYVMTVSVSGNRIIANSTYSKHTDTVRFEGTWTGAGFSGEYTGNYDNPGCQTCKATSGARRGTFTWSLASDGWLQTTSREAPDAPVFPGREFSGRSTKVACK